MYISVSQLTTDIILSGQAKRRVCNAFSDGAKALARAMEQGPIEEVKYGEEEKA